MSGAYCSGRRVTEDEESSLRVHGVVPPNITRRSACLASSKTNPVPGGDSGSVLQQQQPDAVRSTGGCVVPTEEEAAFDSKDYDELQQRYLEPRVRENAELGGGMRLRRQTAPAIIDQDMPGFRQLKRRIAFLTKSNNHAEIYRLLHQLREWEIHAGRMPSAILGGEEGANNDVCEIVDLTRHEDHDPIDVDSYIIDVLLVKVKKEPGAATATSLQSSTSISTTAADVVTSLSTEHIPSGTAPNTGDMKDSKAETEITSQNSNARLTEDSADPLSTEEASVGTVSRAGGMEVSKEETIAATIAKDSSMDQSITSSVKEVIDVDSEHIAEEKKSKCKPIAKWTRAEDEQLSSIVASCAGKVDWATVALNFSGRTYLQCFHRYGLLNPSSSNGSTRATRARAQRSTAMTSVASLQDSRETTTPLKQSEYEESTPDFVESNPAMASSASIVTPEKSLVSDNIADTVPTRASRQLRKKSQKYARDYYFDITNDTFQDDVEIGTRLSMLSQSTLTDNDGSEASEWTPPLDENESVASNEADITPAPSATISEPTCHSNGPDKTSASSAATPEPTLDTPEPSAATPYPSYHPEGSDYTVKPSVETSWATAPSNGPYITPSPSAMTSEPTYHSTGPDITLSPSAATAEPTLDTPEPLAASGNERVKETIGIVAHEVIESDLWEGGDRDDNAIEIEPSAKQDVQPPTENCDTIKTDKTSSYRRRFWTPEEDALLREAVEKNYPHVNWSVIASTIPGRTSQRCRERWCNQLDPNVNRDEWTDSEDRSILEMHADIGGKWTEISKRLGTGRTGYHVQMRTHSLLAKQRQKVKAEAQGEVATGPLRSKKKRKEETPQTHPKSSRSKRSKKKTPTNVKGSLDFRGQLSSASTNRIHGLEVRGAVIPEIRFSLEKSQTEDNNDLTNAWRAQSRQRRKGVWRPTGGWKPPTWACRSSSSSVDAADSSVASSNNLPIKTDLCVGDAINTTNGTRQVATRSKSSSVLCGRAVAARVAELVAANLLLSDQKEGEEQVISSLADVKYPSYQKPTDELLTKAHSVLHTLLPKGDCDCIDAVRLASKYYDYWRPEPGNTRVILLAESHAFTSKGVALSTHLKPSVLPHYKGPREFVSLVYCLAYGENEAIATSKIEDDVVQEAFEPSNNKGTPQFWTLLTACSRGTKYKPPATRDGSISKYTFAADILKRGGLEIEERLMAKLSILEDLRQRGIWLLDASVIGWYISQPQKYRRSKVTNEIHRTAKERPPKPLKAPSLVISWEMFTKHVVREAAEEGNLRLLVPIGKEVEASLTRKRLEDAVTLADNYFMGRTPARVTESFPAPNAWIPGGYGPFFSELARVVNEAAPPSAAIQTDLAKPKDGVRIMSNAAN